LRTVPVGRPLWRPPASGPVRSPSARCAAASWRPAHRPAPFASSGCRPVRSPPLSASRCGSPAAMRRGLAAPPASLARGSASRGPAGRGNHDDKGCRLLLAQSLKVLCDVLFELRLTMFSNLTGLSLGLAPIEPDRPLTFILPSLVLIGLLDEF